MNNKVYSIKRAAMINAIGKYSKIILNILTEVVLARLLTPHDYGIVAIVTVFTTFFFNICRYGTRNCGCSKEKFNPM